MPGPAGAPPPGSDGLRTVLRTITRPGDVDAGGQVPAGWLLARLDQAGAILASGYFARPAALAELAAVRMLAPLELGDHVRLLARPLEAGAHQVQLLMEAWAESPGGAPPRLLARTTARFVPGKGQAPEHLFPGSFPA